jgi:hypothetical protein
MIFAQVIGDLWILALTILTAYLLIDRRKSYVMTPAEYEEWWLIYHAQPDALPAPEIAQTADK